MFIKPSPWNIKKAATVLTLLGLLTLVPANTIPAAQKNPTAAPSYLMQPEYKRTLEKVILTLAINTKDLSSHMDIIENLPDYTKVLMLTPKANMQFIKAALKKNKLDRKVKLIPFKTREIKDADLFVLTPRKKKMLHKKSRDITLPRGTVWAQDLFEVAHSTNGTPSLLTPPIYKWFIQPKSKIMAKTSSNTKASISSDNTFINNIRAANISLSRIPIAFKGGNILIDQFKGQRIAFCGSDIIRETKALFKKTGGTTPSRAEIRSRLKKYLRVDKVVIVGGKKKQPRKLFHLDQAMVLLPDGTAAVTRVFSATAAGKNTKQINEIIKFLADLRGTLRSMGYKIRDMYVSVDDVLNYRYYVNGVPYMNSTTGAKEFLIPLFRGSKTGINSDIYQENINTLKALGYKVIPVPTKANDHHGGIHCMMNVVL